jgi:hypothetical protein
VALIGDVRHMIDGGKAGAWRWTLAEMAGRRGLATAVAVPLFLAARRERGAAMQFTVSVKVC